MFSYVLTTAVLYIGVGYVIGRKLLHTRMPAIGELDCADRRDSSDSVHVASGGGNSDRPASTDPFGAAREEFSAARQFDAATLPPEWGPMLDSLNPPGAKADCTSAVEASALVLKLEVGRYRQELANIDSGVRESIESPNADKLEQSIEQLKQVNGDWRDRQQEATQYLSAQRRSLGEMAPLGDQLTEVLNQQTSQIDAACGDIEMFDFRSSPVVGARRLIIEVRKLVDLAHMLRDCMQEFLVSILCREGRIQSAGKHLEHDSLTALRSRTGIEAFIRRWWRDDQKRLRQVSVAMLDLDHFSQVNESCGPVVSDRLLAAVARLIDELMRKYSGLDWCGRFAGQRFFIFWADTGPHGATSVVERIRQTVADTTFRYSKGDMRVTFTAAVSEVLADDSTTTLFDRVAATLEDAKQTQRNSTYLWQADRAALVQPPQFDVRVKVAELDV